jgi:O-acetyl-ADP-ribose deacetylase (regulator of RNase III)
MRAKVNGVTIQIIQDDILSLSVSSIVNSTDPNLTMNPAMAEKAGLAVEAACAAIGWCAVGSAVMTEGGGLLAKKVIHAVGPRWGEGSERGKLANVTLECLRLAERNRLKSIAIPAISIGTLGYPIENCAKTMLEQIVDFAFEDPHHLKTVIVCLDDLATFTIFNREFAEQIEDLKEAGEGEVTG